VGGCAATAVRPIEPEATDRTDPIVGDLAWLAGSWRGDESNGVRSEEHWIAPDGGTMLGVNRTIAGGRTVFFEYLRIETRDDGVYYVASPRGRDETAFRCVERGVNRAVFENLRHDFPQRISYQRDGDDLQATIEGQTSQGTRRQTFRWRRGPAESTRAPTIR
jgi:hypothetical protein